MFGVYLKYKLLSKISLCLINELRYVVDTVLYNVFI